MLAPRIGARGRIRTRTGDALDVVSLLVGLREQKELEPPAGDAQAGFQYKRNPQAAAWRQNGRSFQCCPGHRGRMFIAAKLPLVGLGDFGRPNDAVKTWSDSYFSCSFFRPSRDGVIFVLREIAQFTKGSIKRQRICHVLLKLIGCQMFHKW